MNMVALIGNVASDPELRHTSAGRMVCNFRLAVSRVGGEEADFFTVVCWERQAEVCKEFLQIGRKVSVQGRLRHTTWEHEGARRSAVEVVAQRVGLLGARKQASDALRADENEVLDAVTAVTAAAADADEASVEFDFGTTGAPPALV